MELSKILNPEEPRPSNPDEITDLSADKSTTGQNKETNTRRNQCKHCTKPAAKNRTVCSECFTEDNRRRSRVRRQSLRRENKCVTCKADLKPDDGVHCSDCAERYRVDARLARERAKKRRQMHYVQSKTG